MRRSASPVRRSTLMVRTASSIVAVASSLFSGASSAVSAAWSVLAGSVLLASVASGVSAQTFGLEDYSGGELFDQFCAACHGQEGRGNGPVAATLNVLVPDLTRLAERNGGDFPASDVRDVIDGRSVVVAHGPRTMPVWGYEFWIEEGADIEAEAAARALIDRIVLHVESIQQDRETGGPRQ